MRKKSAVQQLAKRMVILRKPEINEAKCVCSKFIDIFLNNIHQLYLLTVRCYHSYEKLSIGSYRKEISCLLFLLSFFNLRSSCYYCRITHIVGDATAKIRNQRYIAKNSISFPQCKGPRTFQSFRPFLVTVNKP